MESPNLSPALLAEHPVILFDGICNLCTRSVQFIIERDPQAHFRFASLQSASGQQLAARFGIDTETMESVVLLEGQRCYLRSDAALRIARALSGPWPLLALFRWLPRFLRDGLYRLVARNRYRWFGRRDHCMLPTPHLRQRFL